MPIVEVQQQSVEWLEMRIGMCTASRVGDVVKKLKTGKYSERRYNYMMELVAERLTGRACDHYVTPWMEDGIGSEELARAAYEMQQEEEVGDGNFAIHPQIKWFGASVDALVAAKGGAEFKCLKAENHLEIIKNGVIPVEYAPQMLGEMACYELDYVDFVSFCGRMPKPLRLFVRRMQRDEKLISAMEEEVLTFLEEVVAMLKSLPAWFQDVRNLRQLHRGTNASASNNRD